MDQGRYLGWVAWDFLVFFGFSWVYVCLVFFLNRCNYMGEIDFQKYQRVEVGGLVEGVNQFSRWRI